MSHDLCSAILDKRAWVHHSPRQKKAEAGLVPLYLVHRKQPRHALAANYSKYHQEVAVFHNTARPLPPTFVCKFRTQQTCVLK